jgi:2-dehydropantoate 2-reductase
MASSPRARASALHVADCAVIGALIVAVAINQSYAYLSQRGGVGWLRRLTDSAAGSVEAGRWPIGILGGMTRRYVIFGAGAIGGVMAALLDRAGLEVAVIARGAHLAAIRERGLTLRTPEADATVRVLAAGSAGEIRWRDDDVAVLAVKSQDTDAAVHDLAVAAPPSLVVVCAQNGVANERAALRRFENTLGMLVICPATHLAPGVVEAESSPCPGVMDVGRFPGGVDTVAEEVAAALRSATFDSRAVPDVMRWKYAKLLSNLGNAVEAVCGPRVGEGELHKVVRREGEAVLRAAGIAHASPAEDAARRGDLISIRPIEGRRRIGSSSWQSLARAAGSIEADYLNGEIVLLGRLHEVPAPANALLQRLANRMARERLLPGSMGEGEVLAALGGAGIRPAG